MRRRADGMRCPEGETAETATTMMTTDAAAAAATAAVATTTCVLACRSVRAPLQKVLMAVQKSTKSRRPLGTVRSVSKSNIVGSTPDSRICCAPRSHLHRNRPRVRHSAQSALQRRAASPHQGTRSEAAKGEGSSVGTANASGRKTLPKPCATPAVKASVKWPTSMMPPLTSVDHVSPSKYRSQRN